MTKGKLRLTYPGSWVTNDPVKCIGGNPLDVAIIVDVTVISDLTVISIVSGSNEGVRSLDKDKWHIEDEARDTPDDEFCSASEAVDTPKESTDVTIEKSGDTSLKQVSLILAEIF